MQLNIILNKKPKLKPSGALSFGKYFTDHMFVMEYKNGEWQNARITPYAPFSLDPSASVLHYGQAVFEGAKAFKNEKGEVRLFRFDENLKRLNSSCERVCIPKFDEKFVFDAVEKLILTDRDWIPSSAGTALYIRPAIIAVDSDLGVHAAGNYLFFVILSPVGAYYSGGFAPVKLFVEENYVRAAVGGTGHYKVAGNYAASLKAGENAKKLGCDQVMWLDAKEHRYVEEVGSMNIMFVLDNKIVTPALGGSILPGITRKSVLTLANALNIETVERTVSIDELTDGIKSGILSEIFGTGTAAVISPVGSFIYKNKEYTVGNGKAGKYSLELYDRLTGLQSGKYDDTFGWVKQLK